MYSRLNCYVHKTRYDELMQIVEKRHGILSTIQPEENGVKPKTEGEFVEVEVNFKTLNELNGFIYSGYNAIGLYFYIETVSYVTTLF